MRPVDTGNPPRDYVRTAHADFSFRGFKNLLAIRRFFRGSPFLINGRTITITGAWDFLDKPLSKDRRIKAEQLSLCKAILQAIGRRYREAADPLSTALGKYCSYCEIPVTQHIEVEHIVPKSQFPTLAMEWENFLLACGPCNNKKGAQPTLSYMLRNFVPRPTITSEDEALDAAKNPAYFLLANTAGQPFTNLPATLQYEDAQGTWQDVNNPTDLTITLDLQQPIDYNRKTIYANLPAPLNQSCRVKVTVLPNGTPASLTTNLLGLNEFGSMGLGYDRRVIQRTEAWLEALRIVSQLRATRTQNTFSRLWQNIPALAESKGFWSVWLQVFAQFPCPAHTPPHSPGATYADLGEYFYEDPNVKINFPGTDLSNL